MTHIFDTEVAKEYGVDQAIMIANFQFWISHNAANKRNYHDGKFWTYNSYKALANLFPYWSEKQVRRILTDLVEKGVLTVGNFNQRDFDKTNWYAFINEGYWIKNMPVAPLGSSMCPNGQRESGEESAQMGKPSARSGKSSARSGNAIPDNTTTDVNTDNKRNEKQDAPSGADPKFGEDQPKGNQGEAPPVAPPPLEIKGLYAKMNDLYDKWCKATAGAGGRFGKAEGEAMKKIIIYLGAQVVRRAEEKNVVADEDYCRENILASFNIVLTAMAQKRVDAFLCSQIKITQIESNLLNIINQLKNGNPRDKNKPTNTNDDELRDRFASRFGQQ